MNESSYRTKRIVLEKKVARQVQMTSTRLQILIFFVLSSEGKEEELQTNNFKKNARNFHKPGYLLIIRC
jgi:hypothetical protein